MRTNPGGNIAPEHVVGRDAFIERLWETLAQLGIVLVSERRMGKTSIINKMKAEPRPDTLVLVSDFEHISSPSEFIETLLRDIERHLSAGEKTVGWLKKLWSGLGGVQIAGVFQLPASMKPNWKTVLERVLGDLAQNHAQLQVILIWDELPWMLQKIAHAEGQPVVVDLLDVLRRQRQKHLNLRMVYTGSIGLHHVVSGSTALNDLRTVEVPPLDHRDAITLARSLLLGEKLNVNRLDEVAESIARLVDDVPYYVHHVVASLADLRRPVTPELVSQMVEQSLTDPQDPWKLEHYRNRLPEYYGDRAGLVLGILNLLVDRGPLDISELHEGLKVGFQPDNDTARRIVEGDRGHLRALLKLVQRDHYLSQEESGGYGFRFDLIRRWWQLGLS